MVRPIKVVVRLESRHLHVLVLVTYQCYILSFGYFCLQIWPLLLVIVISFGSYRRSFNQDASFAIRLLVGNFNEKTFSNTLQKRAT